MAQVALTIAGQYIGGPLGAFVGAQIGGFLDRSVLFPTREAEHEGPRLEAIQVQTAEYGIAIPEFWGANKVAGNVIWSSAVRYDDEVKSHLVSFAIGLGAGEISAILRTWANDVLLEDLRSGVLLDPQFDDGQWRFRTPPMYMGMRVYLGTETQMPDPLISRTETANGKPVPAQRGMAYVVFEDWYLAATNNAIPTFTFEVAKTATASVPYETLPISPSDPIAGTVRTFHGFEMGEQECYKIDTWTPPATDDSVVRLYGGDSGDSSQYVHSGNYCMMCHAHKNGTAWFEASLPHSIIAESGDSTSLGGRVQWDINPVEPSRVSFWCYIDTVSFPSLLNGDPEFYYVDLFRAENYHAAATWTTLGLLLVCYRTVAGTSLFLRTWGAHGGVSGTKLLEVGQQYRIQVRTEYNESTDRVEYSVYVDGDLDISGQYQPGLTTRYVELARFGAGIAGGGANPVGADEFRIFFDDIVFAGETVIDYPSQDGTDGWGVPPDYEVARAAPNGAGTYEEWDGTYEDIDETPASTADYVSTPSAGDAKSTFTVGQLPAAVTRVTAVKVAAATYGSTNASLRLVTISGGVEEQTYPVAQRSYPANPLDQVEKVYLADFGRSNADWRHSTVEALEIGVGWLENPGGAQYCVQHSVCVLYAPYGEETSGPSDNLVMHADDVHLTIADRGTWNQYNCTSKTIEAMREHVIGDDPEIPVEGCDFDVDERNVIYTCKWTGSSILDEAYVTRLSGETFEELDSTDWTIEGPVAVRVCRTRRIGWLGIIYEDGAKFLLLNRDTMAWTPWDYLSYDAPTGYEFVAMDVDDSTGYFWLLCNGVDSGYEGQSLVWLLRPLPGSQASAITDEITTEVAGDGVVIRYDAGHDKVMVGVLGSSAGEDSDIVFYDQAVASDVLTLTHVETVTGEAVGPYPKSAWRRGSVDGYMFYAWEENILHRLNLDTRTIDKTYTCDPATGESYAPNWLGGNVYEAAGHSVITGCDLEDANYVRVWLDRATATTVTVGEIVEDICEDVGLAASEVDVTDLTMTVHGFLADNRMRARAAIQALMDAFFFDGVESDGKLKFPVRGGAVVVAIPETDLAAHVAGEERPQELVTTRQQELELPKVVEAVYIAADNNYEQGVQRSTRQVTDSEEIIAVAVPMTITDDQGKQIAEKRHAYAWVQRNTHAVQLSREYTYLDAADPVTVTEGGTTHRVRLEQIKNRGGVLLLDVTNEAVSTYTSDAEGVPAAGEDQGEEVFRGHTKLVLIDTGLMAEVDNTPGLYLSATGYSANWIGATLYLSRDDGDSWAEWGSVDETGTMGVARTALADTGDPWIWDRGGSVNVALLKSTDTLSSATRLEVLNGANLAILGDEIIQWQTATLESDGTYTLSMLTRGRYGTEWATDDHVVGDQFVLLGTSRIDFHNYLEGDYNDQLRFKAVSVGVPSQEGIEQNFTCVIRNMMPWSPQHIRGTRDGSDNLTTTCVRRTRYGGEWEDEVDVPLGETTEAYEVDILSGSTVLRTIETTTQSATYTAAEQTADGLTPGDPVTLTWYPLSSTVVDRGFGTTATV